MEQSIQLKKEGTEGQISITRENVVLGGGAVDSVNGQTGDEEGWEKGTPAI